MCGNARKRPCGTVRKPAENLRKYGSAEDQKNFVQIFEIERHRLNNLSKVRLDPEDEIPTRDGH